MLIRQRTLGMQCRHLLATLGENANGIAECKRRPNALPRIMFIVVKRDSLSLFKAEAMSYSSTGALKRGYLHHLDTFKPDRQCGYASTPL